ncbi:MAG: RDD family protein, partial [Desulfatibacillaceae bacterium]|nr:RDD family protein [Desulfatibacillaceae bacterium]
KKAKTYNLIFTGEIAQGQDRQAVCERLAGLFGIDSDDVETLFENAPDVIKRNADQETARRLCASVEEAGVRCILEEADKAKIPGCCPACGYEALEPDDPLLCGAEGQGECPACGIIVAKYKKPDRPGGDASPARDKETPPKKSGARQSVPARTVVRPLGESKLPPGFDFKSKSPATYGQRVLATIHTLFRAVCICLVLFIGFSAFLRFVLPQRLAGAGNSLERLTLALTPDYFFGVVFLAVAGLVFLWALLLFPMQNRASRGQGAAGIRVLDQNNGLPGPGAFVLRFLGNVLTLALVGLPLLLQVVDKNRRSLADRLSKTWQANEAPLLDAKAVNMALLPVIFAVLLAGAWLMLSVWILETPAGSQDQAADASAQALERESLAQGFERRILSEMAVCQERMLANTGRYSDDFGSLLEACRGAAVSPQARSFIQSGLLEVRLTQEGYLMTLRTGRDTAHVQTQDGYLGIRDLTGL